MNQNASLEQPAVVPPVLDFAKVAVGQRIIIFSMVIVLIAIGIDFTAFSATSAGKLVSLGLNILSIAVSIAGIIYLGLALKLPIWALVLAAITMVVPILNLIVLAIFNARAIKVLKPAGYKVGFFGSSKPA